MTYDDDLELLACKLRTAVRANGSRLVRLSTLRMYLANWFYGGMTSFEKELDNFLKGHCSRRKWQTAKDLFLYTARSTISSILLQRST